jgi:hypothetical protein
VGLLDLVAGYYLLRGGDEHKIDRRDVMNAIQAAYEHSETKDEFVESLLFCLRYARR